MKFNINKADLVECHNRINKYVHNTPVLSSTMINEIVGLNVFFKCENFQKGGAYKMRGALNAILQLSDQEKSKGVTTHSSGNFAQAVSAAAKMLGVKAYIVMPSSSPAVKVAGVKSYGGKVIISGPTLADREAESAKVIKSTGATFLHPSNDIPVITGQGTAAMELLETHPDLDAIFCPIGGGGLIGGSAVAAHYFSSKCKVYGGEPKAVDDAARSMKSGKIETNSSTKTIADGLKTQLGNNNFPIIQKLVEEIITVEEEEILYAMRLVWERMKIIIEPSSSVAFAALIKNKSEFLGKNVGIVVSGGNVDLDPLFNAYRAYLKQL